MSKRMLALMACLALAFGLTACGNQKPEQYDIEVEGPDQQADSPASSMNSESTQQENETVKWVVQPRKDLEIAYSLADYEKLESLPNQGELAFFGQNGGMGVIDQNGKILIPAQEDVHWCPRCGMATENEEKLFDGTGAVIGGGGHGGVELDLYYDVDTDKLYRDDLDILLLENPGYCDAAQAARCIKLVDTDDEFSGWILENWESGRRVDAQLLNKWAVLGLDGKLLGDGSQYDEVYGVEDRQNGMPLTNYPAQEGMVAVKQNGQWKFLWENGDAGPGPYDEVRPYEGGIAAVKTKTGWGFIDQGGKALTPMNFLGAASAYNGRAWVQTADGWGVIELAQNAAQE